MRREKIEGGTAWRWYGEPEPAGEYLAMATIIELRHVWNLPRFEWFTWQVHRQLARTPGLLGYSFRAQLPLRYWTLSAWQDGRALRGFVKAVPHEKVMAALPRAMKDFRHVHWKAAGAALPLAWAEGLQRLDRVGRR